MGLEELSATRAHVKAPSHAGEMIKLEVDSGKAYAYLGTLKPERRGKQKPEQTCDFQVPTRYCPFQMRSSPTTITDNPV